VTGPGIRTFSITDPLPCGTTLLEASAGTGKTWTIASLVTRYVAEGVVRLDEMLVVTFGRAASQELRERVREQLVAAERALAHSGRLDVDSMPVDPRIRPLLGLLRDGTVADLALRRRRVRDALADFDGATIATTHQFCQMVLGSLGVAGDTDAGAHLVEDLDDLLVEVVDDLYVRGFARIGAPPVFSRQEALGIARAAVGDPQALLEPGWAPDDTVAGRRRRFAEAVRLEMDRRKRRLGVLGYDDLLSQLATALEHEDAPARQRMRQRWKVVLVDEFQDTDPVQWQVLDRAFSGHATMVLIGDPKQAIYAFRGGDVVTYLAAARTAQDRATLGTNHRSDAALLSDIQTVLRGAALGDEEIVVRDVKSAHPDPRLVGAPHPAPFRLRMVDQATFGVQGTKGVAIGRLREHVARDLAADIAALLGAGATFDGRLLLPRDIAVLCETRKQCAAAQHGLRANGIRAVVSGSGSVFATAAAAEWLSLLEAMEQPHRTARVRSAALTVFFGRTADELATGGDAVTDRDAETIRDWADLLKQRGVAAVLEAASASGALAHRVLGLVDGERLMTDLRHTGEALHEAATHDGLGLIALVAWLCRQMTETRLTISTERSRRLDSDASAVQILTIHGSKGLQFPVVYLPSVGDTFPRAPGTPLFHDDQGRRCIDVAGKDVDPVNRARAVVEESGEDLRLLYVALTRAQSQVVAWWLPSQKNTTTAPFHRILFGRGPDQARVPASTPMLDDADALERARRWEAAGGPVVEQSVVAGADTPPVEVGSDAFSVRRFTRAVDHDWRRTSYTGLSSAAEVTARCVLPSTSEPEDPPREDEPVLMTGRVPTGRPPTDRPPTDRLPTDRLPTDRLPTDRVPAARPDAKTAGSGAKLAGPDAAAVRSLMADLPVGATFGSLVHAVLEHADPAAPDRGGDWRAELRHHIDEQLVRWPATLDPDVLVEALLAVCDTPLGPLAPTTLRQLGRVDRMSELDFELPLAGGDDRRHDGPGGTLRDLAAVLRQHLAPDDPLRPFADVVDSPAYEGQTLRGYLTGSLDVVLRVGGRYLVADYKTNWLGDLDEDLTTDAYRPDRLAAAMSSSSYPLQALLYAVVLHRFLRWRVAGYSPADHLGGVLYLYVRGMAGPGTPLVNGQPCGVFSWRPPVSLVEAVSDLLDGRPEGAS